jgi:putative redox protein
MRDYSITTKHKGKMAFEADLGRHKIIMDTETENGGDDSGPRPKRLLLGTLATCTGMDVVSLLEKMRVPFSDFDIITEADLSQEHPKVFTAITVIYRIRVAAEHRDKVQKAVDLSQEKYCGISAMLRKNSPMDYTIEYL